MYNQENINEGYFAKDIKSYEELFRLYYPRLKRYASAILRNNDEAEDLVQDVFFQIWQNKSELNKEKNIGSYLFTMMKNKCLNLLKHKVVEERYLLQNIKLNSEELYHISFNETTSFLSMEEQLFKELEPIIISMPEKCQVAFRYKWFEGKKNREIAELMDISSTMVDKHLARGLGILRKKLTSKLFILFMMIYLQNP